MKNNNVDPPLASLETLGSSEDERDDNETAHRALVAKRRVSCHPVEVCQEWKDPKAEQ